MGQTGESRETGHIDGADRGVKENRVYRWGRQGSQEKQEQRGESRERDTR